MTPELFFVTVVASYVLWTARLNAGPYLFCTLKVGIAMVRAKCKQRTAELSAALRASGVQREDPRRDFVQDDLGIFPRHRILQLHEQGESPAAIAQSLGLPVGQVTLLLKVRRLVGETPSFTVRSSRPRRICVNRWPPPVPAPRRPRLSTCRSR